MYVLQIPTLHTTGSRQPLQSPLKLQQEQVHSIDHPLSIFSATLLPARNFSQYLHRIDNKSRRRPWIIRVSRKLLNKSQNGSINKTALYLSYWWRLQQRRLFSRASRRRCVTSRMSGDTSAQSPRGECVTYTSKVYRWQICDMIPPVGGGRGGGLGAGIMGIV
ncbi:hypothetical protein Zmor_024061 [Zophobas morio]|uniref:Uncharacterized protein n=1 Tax=Zophobas morio TaxID=2755281 RepID=A0AA38HZI2_9CUCU|nr:hypothetical protein Zmor_024061 [Zophobas morio]